ncbi:uncharacterized protein TNCV_2220681 [Trichonephila clavipes]|nr:uncharacterized protein TNCV_2220681 [Trichonephila clavipes]
MMEAGGSARRVARQLGRSDCAVRRCKDQWIREMSFTRRPGSGCLQQTSHRDERHIGILCLLEPYECNWLKDIWDRDAHYVCCPERPPIDASVCSGATPEETGLQLNGTWSSLATKPDSISAVIIIVFVCEESVQGNARPHMARVSQNCLCTVTTLPCLARHPDLSPIENIWDHLGWRVGHPTSLNELEKTKRASMRDDYREVVTNYVQSILGFQECEEKDVETWMACDAEGCGFQLLNDDEIGTSMQEESNPVDD